MELARINDIVSSFGVSSRTLRYYEQTGLLWSCHPENKAQRYYDEAALERLSQIIILRKLQIPVKDIVHIFKHDDTAELIKAFERKLGAIDADVAALSELRLIVDEFLIKMKEKGIKKISGIALLYEETGKRLYARPEPRAHPTMETLLRVSREHERLRGVSVIRLPSMRVLTCYTKASGGMETDDIEDARLRFAEYGVKPTPGLRDSFYIRKPGDVWVLTAQIPQTFVNDTPYVDDLFMGGLFAVASTVMEEMDATVDLLKRWAEESEHFVADIDAGGVWRCDVMVEEILPWDIAEKLKRYQQDVFIPIRER